ncbi:MAG TPA: efflux RND transporter permease subunit [Aestuariivirgaceae bacterium]|jgi:multidrug efflux pump
MQLPEISIKRPVFATVLSLVLLLVGVVSYQRLTVREYPNIDEPVVSVSTTYPGASATIVESQVTQILEGTVAGIEGIDTIESSSRAESSRITITFSTGIDIAEAASDVRDRVSRVRRQLPDEITEPVIAKVEADAQPIIFLVFRSESMDPLELTDYVDRYVIDRFKNLTGVADVQIYGERRYAMRVWIDSDRLAGFGITIQDVENAIRNQNAEFPAGRIESSDREFTVLSRTGLSTPEEFGNIVVKSTEGYQVKLREVARITEGAENERRDARYNGVPSISVGIIKQAVANPLDVSKALREVLPRVNQSLPQGLSVEIGNDTSVFIERSINAVFVTIAEAVALVVLVIFLFLRSFRASVIPIVTIPVSLVGTFALMYATGLTINTLTLLAMVLAIGLVVDDAIVMLENIYRHVEEGMKPLQAALLGSREIGFAIVAMSLTLAAVYAPVAFTPGRTGRLFMEFALTLAGAVLISGFVALSLTPMMCAKLLRHERKHGRLFTLIENGIRGLERGYRRTLRTSLKARPLVFLTALAVAGVGAFYFTQLKAELSPVEDRGVFQIRGTAPEGSTLAYTRRYGGQVEALLRSVPELRSTLIIAGWPEVTRFNGFARLTDWGERERSQQEIVASLQPKLARIAGMQVFATNPASLGVRGGSQPVQFVVQTSGTYEQLKDYADQLLERIESYPGLTNVDTDLNLNSPELAVDIDRAKVADLGLDMSVIGRTMETLLGGREVTRYEVNGEQFSVMVQLNEEERSSPATLSRIYVRSPEGQMVQLSNIVKVRETVVPKELRRFNQLRAVTIQANVAPGYALGEALSYLESAAREILPADVLTDVTGQSREFRTASSNLAIMFVLALMFIYLVLSAQFESFRDPLLIMLTVPLSMTGALAALHYTGGTLNVYSQIGLVTLVGLITKHGILIVEFANQMQAKGMTRFEAAIEAAGLRLRPILMTTGAMVLGAVPLALAHGAGAESRQQIGWVIVGGMLLGTLLTLFVIPAVYTVAGRRSVAQAPATAQTEPAE